MSGEEIRKTGIDVIGDAHWGTHFCQFYQDKEDLIDVLVPYFKAGLENNEFCVWVTSGPLGDKEAREALRKAVPDFERYLQRGQIEILDYDQWYTKTGRFEPDKVLPGWVDKLNQALARGFDGLRLTGNTFWLGKEDWQHFTDYEEVVSNVIGKYRMLALCSYSLERCSLPEVMDVLKNHRSALIRREGKWDVIQSAEQMRAEEALRESDGKYRALFENMLDGFAYCKILADENNRPIDFVYLEVNDAFERLTGLKKEDVVGKKVTEAIPGIKEAHSELFNIYGKVASTGEPTKFDIYFMPLAIWLTISVYSPQKGYFVAVFENITERKQAEEALRDRSRLNQILLDSMPCVVLLLRPHTREIVASNEAAVKVGAVPGKTCFATWAQREEPCSWCLAPGLWATGEAQHCEPEYRGTIYDAYWVPVSEDLYMHYAFDITEHRRAEERERRLQQELQVAGRLASIGELAAGVAHEINNPLTAIIGFSERLLGKSTDEAVSRDLERINSEGWRAAGVVQNLLTFARRREPKKTYSDVHLILQKALELRLYELQTGNIGVEPDFAPDLPRTMVDFHQIEQVFLNIIINAEQAMLEAHGKGKLTISTRDKNGHIEISFTDDGPGILDKHLSQIFDPFFSTRVDRGGTGLGLSVCHGIITDHGGKIHVSSRPEKGATFTVRLPIITEKIIDESKLVGE